jgi:hypothetical protein
MTWPPAVRPARGAWIRALSPLTAGGLCALLVLAGFGIGVVVGWQHDGHGDRVGPAGFYQKGQLRPGDGMPGFPPGPGYRHFGPGQRDQQVRPGQAPNQPNQPNLPSRPTPSGTATS